MRTRNGYVSNSSSSSFIVYGKELDYYDAIELMADNENKVICILDHKGTSGDVEDFVFRMTNHRMSVLEKNGIDVAQMDGRYILVMKEWFNDGGVMNITEPLTGGRIFDVRKDDSSPCTDSDRDRNFARWVKCRSVK